LLEIGGIINYLFIFAHHKMNRQHPLMPQTGLMPTRTANVPTTLAWQKSCIVPQVPRNELPNSNINNRTEDHPFKFNPYAIWENNRPPNYI
jgi:hypothetical protein